MLKLFQIFIEICLFRKGPQHLPNSMALNAISIFLFSAASAFSLSMTGNPKLGLAWAAIGPLLISLSTTLILRRFNFIERIQRTVCAFAGTGALLIIMTLPLDFALAQSVAESGQIDSGLALASLGVLFWSLMIDAHIWAQALSARFGIGVLCSALMFIVILIVSDLFRTVVQ